MRRTNSNELNALKWVLVACISVFILQVILTEWFKISLHEDLFALSAPKISQGFVWTPFTYAFLHGDTFHLLINVLVIYFIGRIIESLYGSKNFILIFSAGILMGGLTWLAVNYNQANILVGASAGGFALLTFFCLAQPDQMVTLLLFFIIPVNMKPKWLLLGLLGIEAFMFIFFERQGESKIASSAHLGGMLGGFLVFQFVTKGKFFSLPKKKVFERPKWTGKIIHRSPKRNFTVNITDRETLKKEVDIILDKINNEGFGSLTEQEKKILDQARDILK